MQIAFELDMFYLLIGSGTLNNVTEKVHIFNPPSAHIGLIIYIIIDHYPSYITSPLTSTQLRTTKTFWPLKKL